MRRLLTLVLSTLTVVVLSAMFLAGPALATEESEPAGEEAAAADGFGAGDWDGLILAAITGVLVGIVVFADSKPGEIGHAGHH